jgi:hypothetical protein
MVTKLGFVTIVIGFIVILFSKWNGHFDEMNTLGTVGFVCCTVGAVAIIVDAFRGK